MLIALLVGLAVLSGAASAALAWSHARRVKRVTSSDAAAHANALKRVPKAERLAELERRSAPGSWEHRLATEAREAPHDAARIAIANEALADVEHALAEGAGWPSASFRIAVLSGLLLGAAAYLVSGELRWSLAILGAGAVAALSCLEAGRSARRDVDAQRVAIDALVAVALSDLVDAPGADLSRAGRGHAHDRRASRRRGAAP